MTSIEARLDHLRVVGQRQGLSLAECLALCIANEFVMDWDALACYLAKILEDCSYAKADGLVTVVGCMRERWLDVLPTGNVTLTQDGQRILAELVEYRNPNARTHASRGC